MLARKIRRKVARLVKKFTKGELRDAMAAVERCKQEFFAVHREVAAIDAELQTASDNCVSALLRKMAMNHTASARLLEAWAAAIDKAVALKAEGE